MADSLYYADSLAWSEQQADLLRRLASGEQINTLVDWENVIEEVQDVGRSEMRACESLLGQALVHLLKIHAWPNSSGQSYWPAEVVAFLNDAERAFAPSMRQRIDLKREYGRALKQLARTVDDSGSARPLPQTCPVDIIDLIGSQSDVDALLAKFAAAGQGYD